MSAAKPLVATIMSRPKAASAVQQSTTVVRKAAEAAVDLFADAPMAYAVERPLQAALSESLSAHERIKSIEDALFEKALDVVHGTLDFADIADDAKGPPQEWIDQLGLQGALRRFRLARGGGMGSKEAPAAIKAATAIVAAVAKAKAMEKAGPRTLAISFVQMTAPAVDYPRRIVESNDK